MRIEYDLFWIFRLAGLSRIVICHIRFELREHNPNFQILAVPICLGHAVNAPQTLQLEERFRYILIHLLQSSLAFCDGVFQLSDVTRKLRWPLQPPPTSAGPEALWCGVLKGRCGQALSGTWL